MFVRALRKASNEQEGTLEAFIADQKGDWKVSMKKYGRSVE